MSICIGQSEKRDMDKPLVSIIIPVYNVEQYLSQCLDSVLGQTYTNIEVICVNDGSTDDSITILANYSKKDKRLFVINTENQGVSNARNVGLEHKKGDFVMFVDSDDWLDSDCVEKIFEYQCTFQCDIVMFSYVRERAHSSVKKDLFSQAIVLEEEEREKMARRIIGPINEEITSPSSLDSYGTVWGKLYCSQVIAGLRFVDLKNIGTAEDSLFNMFAFKRSDRIGFVPNVYYHYRRNVKSSLTGGSIPGLLEKWKVLFSIIDENFKEQDEKLALSNRIALGTLGLLINAYISSRGESEIRDVLNDNMIHNSLVSLNKRYLPFHWRLFYYIAELKCSKLVFMLVAVIQALRGDKKE